MQETQVWSPGWEDPLEKDILAWRISWAKEPGELQSMGSQKCQTQLSDWAIRILHIPVCLLSSVGTLWCPTAPPHFLALVSIAKSILGNTGNTGNTGSLFSVFFTSACCLPSFVFSWWASLFFLSCFLTLPDRFPDLFDYLLSHPYEILLWRGWGSSATWWGNLWCFSKGHCSKNLTVS